MIMHQLVLNVTLPIKRIIMRLMQLMLQLQVIVQQLVILVILLILLQQRGASLGAGFGSSGELYTTRRGLEKSLFVATIVFAVIFVASIFGLLLVPVE